MKTGCLWSLFVLFIILVCMGFVNLFSGKSFFSSEALIMVGAFGCLIFGALLVLFGKKKSSKESSERHGHDNRGGDDDDDDDDGFFDSDSDSDSGGGDGD